MDSEFQKLYQDPNNFDASFKKLVDRVYELIQSSVSKDEKILLLSSDLDNIGCACVVNFLMKGYKLNYTSALALLRERRISIKIEKQPHNYLRML